MNPDPKTLVERLEAEAGLTVESPAPHLTGDMKFYVYDAEHRAILREAAQSLAARDGVPARVARGDAARMNAIQRNMWFVEPDYAAGGWRVGKAVNSGQLQHYAPTLREAIDKAIAAPTQPQQEARDG